VLFGEMVPFRYGRLRFLYLWLNSLSPFGQGGYEYSLTPGDGAETFTMRAREGGAAYRFGVPICYEDVMPYVCRKLAWDAELDEKRVDFLLNISNDGWFLHRNELPQHFAICTFRAVENRVGVARTVNTGVSGFIDPDGRAHDKIGVGETAWRVARVMIDTRKSLYSRTGDLFALACAVVWALLCVDYVLHRALAGGNAEDEVTE
ncbi:MAG: nitrilase-related carbon-nitrogen hydrolase, partial [Phycisphaerae bacterium]